MTRRKEWALAVGVASVVALGTALLIPEREPAVAPPAGHVAFVWGQDDVWARLEREFDRARERGCEGSAAAIDAGLAGLDATLAEVERARLGPEAPLWSTLEGQLFEVAPRLGACPSRVPELIARTSRLRRAVEAQRVRWDFETRVARDTQYRLLYGSRAALEELLLAMPDADAPALVAGVSEPSETPSFTFEGVELHSGDILASRGGAPTSAFIARGNDYPGNFSHIALLHVSEDGTPTVIESHIELGAVASSADDYLADVKLRILVMRVRADHPALRDDPMLPHRAASAMLARVRAGHIPYDFAMDGGDPSALFCSEVAAAAYAGEGVRLWRHLSSMSGRGLTRWLSRFGVTHFETLAPSDLEYDPQVRVVAEWRDPDTLFADHEDGAILDVLLEGAEAGDEIGYDYAKLPLARLAKGYSVLLELGGGVGPIPEGMSATTGLRVDWLQVRHGAIRAALRRRVASYRAEHHRRPPYWALVRLAAEAKAEVDGGA